MKTGYCGAFTTNIGKSVVPVRNYRHQAVAKFSDGYYAFWTCVLKKAVHGKKKIWGRAQVGLSAGDRFDRMKREMLSAKNREDRLVYRKFWGYMCAGKNVSCVRPSTKAELKKWFDTHPDQKKHLLKRV